MFALMSSVVGFAQLLEVKGVETKLVIYDDQEYRYYNYHLSRSGYSTEWFGFSFYNMNSITVSVEAELYYAGELVDTKAFSLASKETYIWKQKHNSDFQVYSDYDSFEWSGGKKEVPADYDKKGSINGSTYYIKYKAYKIL